MLSLYHIRPVPDHLDGRTDEARKEAGAPLPSLWLDENTPGMYKEAAELRDLGFRSRDTTLAMLDQCNYPVPSLQSLPSRHTTQLADLCIRISRS